MTPLVQFVVALAATLTATAAVACVHYLREFTARVEANEQRSKQNEQRSMTNRRVLRSEGFIRPERAPAPYGATDD